MTAEVVNVIGFAPISEKTHHIREECKDIENRVNALLKRLKGAEIKVVSQFYNGKVESSSKPKLTGATFRVKGVFFLHGAEAGHKSPLYFSIGASLPFINIDDVEVL
jgi:hypothetical protein